MKIKASTVLSIISFVGVAVTAVLAAKGGKEAEKIEEEMERTSLDFVEKKDIYKATWKCYIPALVSGIATIGCGAYAKRLDTKEIIKLTGAVGALTAELGRVTNNFSTYRAAVVDEIGVEREAQIRQSITDRMVTDAETGITEGVYRFHLDWLGEDLYFDAPVTKVIIGLNNINKRLNDPNDPDWMEPTVTHFFNDIGHPEFCSKDSDKAGWHYEELSVDCGTTWINWRLIPKCDQYQQIYYEIWVDWYPWEDIMGMLQKLENEGII